MKRRLQHRVPFTGILFAFIAATAQISHATGRSEARVSQAIHNVQLLPQNAGPRPASTNDNVRQGTSVRTGSDSRAELAFTDRALARLGANSLLSFAEGDFDFANGSMLLYLPKRSERARINTAVATATGASFTVMAEYRPKSWIKFIVLEGRGTVSLKQHPGETRTLRAGQMIMVPQGAMRLPEPQNVDLSNLIKTALLVTQFPPLPSLPLILSQANDQQISPPSSRVIDPAGLNARDQRAATMRPPRP